METINKISDEEIEIVVTREMKHKITKTQLLDQQKRIEEMLKNFD